MKKVLFVFGTRPEAIKMVPVVLLFKKDKKNFKTLIAVTAQHREMLDQVLNLFEIKPDFDLNLMTKNQSLEIITQKIILSISKIINAVNPDIVFVQGDTTTTFAASLAAYYKKIPVGHIEAGLRTNNKYSPFPEECNRRMTSSIASYHFAPTKQAYQNLINEGFEKSTIEITGNTVIDSLLYVSKKVETKLIDYEKFFFKKYGIQFNNKKTLLVTGHRRESFGNGFKNICKSIKKISQNKEVQIVYPVHLNPNVQKPVNKILKNIKNIYLIPPQDYVPFVFLMKQAYLILTDSGGVQEEAPSLGKPVLVMRDSTERPEGITAGTSRLVGTEVKKIVSTVKLLLQNQSEYDKMTRAINPYGDGKASLKIINFVKQNL